MLQPVSRRLRRHRFEQLEARTLLAGDLVAYWLADDLNDSHADQEVISSWTDRVSGIVAESIGEPRLAVGAIGGRAAVQFDGMTASGFNIDKAFSPLSDATDFSVAVVFATNSATLAGNQGDWFDNTGLVDSSRLGFGRDWGLTMNSAGQIATGLGNGFGRRVFGKATVPTG